jgi:DnaD/phage-associated family protein
MGEGDREVPVSADLIRDLLARGSDLAEVKAVLTVLLLATERGGPVSLADLQAPESAAGIVPDGRPEPRPVRVRRAIDAAVADGLLVRLRSGDDLVFLPSSPGNRAAVGALLSGDPAAAEALRIDANGDVAVYRPNVFALYERHIGPLSPLVAESLREAERTYPRVWIEEAFAVAAEQNKRSWRYVEAILSRWEETGGPSERWSGERW